MYKPDAVVWCDPLKRSGRWIRAHQVPGSVLTHCAVESDTCVSVTKQYDLLIVIRR